MIGNKASAQKTAFGRFFVSYGSIPDSKSLENYLFSIAAVGC